MFTRAAVVAARKTSIDMVTSHVELFGDALSDWRRIAVAPQSAIEDRIIWRIMPKALPDISRYIREQFHRPEDFFTYLIEYDTSRELRDIYFYSLSAKKSIPMYVRFYLQKRIYEYKDGSELEGFAISKWEFIY